MKKQNSTLVTYLLFFLIGVFSFSPYIASALDQGDVEITMVTAPWFVQDHNECDLVPEAAYVGFEITNLTAGQLTGLQYAITISGNGYQLAGDQAPILQGGALDAGESGMAYFYVEFPCETASTGTFGLTVTDDSGGTGHYNEFLVDNVPVLEVGEAEIDSVSLSGGQTTAEPLYFTVYYSFGNIKVGDEFNLQPAGNLDFEAGSYQLTATEVISSDVLAIPAGSTDSLYYVAYIKQTGTNYQCAMRYTFEVKFPEVSTPIFAYVSHWSGSQHNYNNDYGDMAGTITFPGATPIPDILIQKFTNGLSADTPPGPIVAPGETITWTYVVTNPGEVPLTGVDIIDDNGTPDTGDDFSPSFDGGDLDGDGYLDLGETWTFTYEGIAVGGQYSNIGYTEGTDAVGNVVTDTNQSHYFGSMPALDIELHTNGEDADEPTGPSLIVGSTVTWTYYVMNTGNIGVTNVSVTDINGTPGAAGDDFSPGYVSGDNGNGILDVGEQWIFEATGIAQEGQYATRATATADEPAGQTFSDRDDGHYIGVPPAIRVEVATNGDDADVAPGPYVPIGERILWTYTVTNHTLGPLSNITIIDDRGTPDPGDDFVPVFLGGDENEDGNLDTGETWTYQKRGFSLVPDQYGNKATVTGMTPEAQQLTDSDRSHFWGTAASLYVENLTNGIDADSPEEGPYLSVGDQVTWTYSVTNNGNVDLTNLLVTDDNGTPRNTTDDFYPAYLSGDINENDTIEIGETWVYEATGSAKTGQYGNWSKVKALSPANRYTYDTDKSHYFGVVTTLSIDLLTEGQAVEAPSGPTLEEGSEVTWIYNVTLEGNSHLERLTLIDDNGTPKDPEDDFNPGYISGDENRNGYLDPEETWVYMARGTAIQGQYASRCFASARNLAGKRAEDIGKSFYYGVPQNDFMEFGDAPEGTLAYPELGTIGTFPTGKDETFASYIGHKTRDMFFGPMFDLELDGNTGIFNPHSAELIIDECFDDGDAGLIKPSSYTIDPNNVIVPCTDATYKALGRAFETVSWGSSIDIDVKNYSEQQAYVNVLFDWNQDGQWAFNPQTVVNDQPVPEHAVVNFPVPPGFSGNLSELLPPDIQIGPQNGYIWVRFSITPEPVTDNWTGSGIFADGETEDYLLYVSTHAVVPLTGWTLFIVMLAMIITTFLIYRRK